MHPQSSLGLCRTQFEPLSDSWTFCCNSYGFECYYSSSSRYDGTFGEMSCLTDSLFNLISSDDVRVISNTSLDHSDFPDLIHFSDTEDDVASDHTMCDCTSHHSRNSGTATVQQVRAISFYTIPSVNDTDSRFLRLVILKSIWIIISIRILILRINEKFKCWQISMVNFSFHFMQT